jgi:hypothetical protein
MAAGRTSSRENFRRRRRRGHQHGEPDANDGKPDRDDGEPTDDRVQAEARSNQWRSSKSGGGAPSTTSRVTGGADGARGTEIPLQEFPFVFTFFLEKI